MKYKTIEIDPCLKGMMTVNKEKEEIIRNLGDTSDKIADKNILITGGAGFYRESSK